MMKNGKKDMSDKLKLKGHMKAFMRWPLILSALLIVLNIWVYFVSVKAGIIVSGGIDVYKRQVLLPGKQPGKFPL